MMLLGESDYYDHKVSSLDPTYKSTQSTYLFNVEIYLFIYSLALPLHG
jgi:hypothetical protein